MKACLRVEFISAYESDDSIVFSIVAVFLSVNATTREPLHLAWWNFSVNMYLHNL